MNIPTIEEMLIKHLATSLNNDNVTPEQHYKKWKKIYPETDKFFKTAMQEFTKLHCEKQARVISKKVEFSGGGTYKTDSGHLSSSPIIIDKDSILNAYDLNNIK